MVTETVTFNELRFSYGVDRQELTEVNKLCQLVLTEGISSGKDIDSPQCSPGCYRTAVVLPKPAEICNDGTTANLWNATGKNVFSDNYSRLAYKSFET